MYTLHINNPKCKLVGVDIKSSSIKKIEIYFILSDSLCNVYCILHQHMSVDIAKKINESNYEYLHRLINISDDPSVSIFEIHNILSNPYFLNSCDHKGNTLLIKAIVDDCYELVKLLVELNSDVNIRNFRGKTALHFASKKKNIIHNTQTNTSITQLLIGAGADINCKNEIGDTALHISSRHNNYENVKLLLDASANPDIQNRIGKTALHVSSYQDRHEIGKLLIYANANLNIMNRWGETALHIASRFRHYRMMHAILDYVLGKYCEQQPTNIDICDINIRDNSNCTVLRIVASDDISDDSSLIIDKIIKLGPDDIMQVSNEYNNPHLRKIISCVQNKVKRAI